MRRVGVVAIGLLALCAALAPLLAPYDPSLPSGVPLTPPGREHPLGTNDIGQDVWSQWLWGGRASLLVALAVTLLTTGLACAFGLVAGLWPRGEAGLLALADLLLAIPAVPLYALIVVLVGPSQLTLTLALGLLSWPAFGRIVRARILEVRGAPYIEAARCLGATPLRIGLLHVAPAAVELLPVILVLTVRFAIFAEATLSFLGLGDPNQRSWGSMLGWALSDPLVFVGRAWTWWVLPPAFAIVLAVLSTTWLGE